MNEWTLVQANSAEIAMALYDALQDVIALLKRGLQNEQTHSSPTQVRDPNYYNEKWALTDQEDRPEHQDGPGSSPQEPSSPEDNE
jgi:hypothetical protein